MVGGWWEAKKYGQIKGSVAIELGNRTFVSALDDGKFTVGSPRDEGMELSIGLFVSYVCVIVSTTE